MAEDKKITKPEETSKRETPAVKAVAASVSKSLEVKKASVKPAEKKAAPRAVGRPAAAKPAVGKTVRKAAAKPANKAAKDIAKPVGKAAKAVAKPVGKAAKAVAKPVAKGGRRKADVSPTAKVTTALWKRINTAKAKRISGEIAIQVYAEGLDTFYIAVQNGTPKIDPYEYVGNNGSFYSSEKELLKIASGKYDIIAAVKSGAVSFNGTLSVFLKIMDLF